MTTRNLPAAPLERSDSWRPCKVLWPCVVIGSGLLLSSLGCGSVRSTGVNTRGPIEDGRSRSPEETSPVQWVKAFGSPDAVQLWSDDRSYVVLSRAGEATLWHTGDGRPRLPLGHGDAFRFSPHGRRLAVQEKSQVRVIDLATLRNLGTLDIPANHWLVSVSDDPTRIFTMESNSPQWGQASTAKSWGLVTWNLTEHAPTSVNSCGRIALVSPDHRRAITQNVDPQSVSVVEFPTCRALATYQPAPADEAQRILRAVFSPDANQGYLALGTETGDGHDAMRLLLAWKANVGFRVIRKFERVETESGNRVEFDTGELVVDDKLSRVAFLGASYYVPRTCVRCLDVGPEEMGQSRGSRALLGFDTEHGTQMQDSEFEEAKAPRYAFYSAAWVPDPEGLEPPERPARFRSISGKEVKLSVLVDQFDDSQQHLKGGPGWLATTRNPNTLLFLDLKAGKLTPIPAKGLSVYAVSPDRSHILLMRDGRLEVMSLDSKAPSTQPLTVGLQMVADTWSADSRYLRLSGRNGEVLVDARTGKQTPIPSECNRVNPNLAFLCFTSRGKIQDIASGQSFDLPIDAPYDLSWGGRTALVRDKQDNAYLFELDGRRVTKITDLPDKKTANSSMSPDWYTLGTSARNKPAIENVVSPDRQHWVLQRAFGSFVVGSLPDGKALFENGVSDHTLWSKGGRFIHFFHENRWTRYDFVANRRDEPGFLVLWSQTPLIEKDGLRWLLVDGEKLVAVQRSIPDEPFKFVDPESRLLVSQSAGLLSLYRATDGVSLHLLVSKGDPVVVSSDGSFRGDRDTWDRLTFAVRVKGEAMNWLSGSELAPTCQRSDLLREFVEGRVTACHLDSPGRN